MSVAKAKGQTLSRALTRSINEEKLTYMYPTTFADFSGLYYNGGTTVGYMQPTYTSTTRKTMGKSSKISLKSHVELDYLKDLFF